LNGIALVVLRVQMVDSALGLRATNARLSCPLRAIFSGWRLREATKLVPVLVMDSIAPLHGFARGVAVASSDRLDRAFLRRRRPRCGVKLAAPDTTPRCTTPAPGYVASP
jgi:hypothetical protein